jgi:hypothetical protein
MQKQECCKPSDTRYVGIVPGGACRPGSIHWTYPVNGETKT